METKSIYLDNNAWQPVDVQQNVQYVQHVNSCNPNSQTKMGTECRKIITSLKEYIPYIAFGTDIDYEMSTIIASSGTDANVNCIWGFLIFLLRGMNGNIKSPFENDDPSKVNSRDDCFPIKIGLKKKQRGDKQINFVTTSVEHTSIMYIVRQLIPALPEINVELIHPNEYGQITLEQAQSKINKNTDIISILHASNNTGIINRVEIIAEYAKKLNPDVFVHSDMVQSFSKVSISPKYVDAITIAMQKTGGPTGISFICIKKHLGNFFLSDYSTANEMGGTLNMGLAAAAQYHSKTIYSNSDITHDKLISTSQYFLEKLRQNLNIIYYNTLIDLAKDKKKDEFIALFSEEKPNVIIYGNYNNSDNQGIEQITTTFLLSFVQCRTKGNILIPYCRFFIKEELESYNVIVGLGSACKNNATNEMLKQMRVNEIFLQSAIRVSMGLQLCCQTSQIQKEINRFVQSLEMTLASDQNLMIEYIP